MLMLFPKVGSLRLTYDILMNFLNALLDDKIDINHIVNEDIQQKFNDCILSKGSAHESDVTDFKVIFDKEISENFDENERKSIKHIFESNYLFNYIIIFY